MVVMGKKCIICEKEAEFKIKDSNEFYCKTCAKNHFADISYLQKIEEAAKELKKTIKDKMKEEEE